MREHVNIFSDFLFSIGRGLVFYNQEFKEYSIRFMGSDGSVVKWSQCYLHTELQETPVSYWLWYTMSLVAFSAHLSFM